MSLYLGENLISGVATPVEPSRNIGQIIQSTIPLTDAGLHLLDGSLISGSGSYSAFVDYIADLYDSGDYTAIFETEANWQTSVTSYGVCGKFVYDDVNNTVRLPKYSNKIYTSGGTAPVVGNGMTLGLTNGSTNVGLISSSSSGLWQSTGSYGTSASDSGGGYTQSYDGSRWTITSDGTKSGIIADLSNITTSVDGYYYIVIATSTKTDIQVDIDEIATDLNGKADVDLSNTTPSQSFITSSFEAYSPDWSAGVTKSSSGFTAVEDGWLYINVAVGNYASFTSNIIVYVNSVGVFQTTNVNTGYYTVNTGLIPLNANDIVTVNTSNSYTNMIFYPLKGVN